MTSIIGAINAIRKIESCAIDTFLNFNWPQIDSGQYKILLKSKKNGMKFCYIMKPVQNHRHFGNNPPNSAMIFCFCISFFKSIIL